MFQITFDGSLFINRFQVDMSRGGGGEGGSVCSPWRLGCGRRHRQQSLKYATKDTWTLSTRWTFLGPFFDQQQQPAVVLQLPYIVPVASS